MDIVDMTKKLARHTRKRYRERKLGRIKRIVLHHSATAPIETGDGLQDVRAFARYHVSTKGWPGIGYHFVIPKSGLLVKTNELETVSYHVGRHNTPSIGICLVGNFDHVRPGEKQWEALDALLCHLGAVLGRRLPVTFHRQFALKSCPGKAITDGDRKRLNDVDLYDPVLNSFRFIWENWVEASTKPELRGMPGTRDHEIARHFNIVRRSYRG